MTEPDQYLLGYSEAEQDRLERQAAEPAAVRRHESGVRDSGRPMTRPPPCAGASPLGENRPAMEADYVIVGAGAAGCVLAARLCEDPTISVLLLESGGRGRHLLLRIPKAFYLAMQHPEYAYFYPTGSVSLGGPDEVW